VLERALRNIAGAEESLPEIDWERLHACLKPWRQYLAEARRNPEGQSLRSYRRCISAIERTRVAC